VLNLQATLAEVIILTVSNIHKIVFIYALHLCLQEFGNSERSKRDLSDHWIVRI
jgi:hypothetical protein